MNNIKITEIKSVLKELIDEVWKKYSLHHTDDDVKRYRYNPEDAWRGPHAGAELQLMLKGKKPAAIIPRLYYNQFKPYIDNGIFICEIVDTYPEELDISIVVSLPSEKNRLKKIVKILKERRDGIHNNTLNPSEKIKGDIKLGILLGYSKPDILNWVTKSSDPSIVSEGYIQESMFPKGFNRHTLGSCMDAAKYATKYFLKKGITNFKIVEGFVSLYTDQEEHDFSAHTWIEFSNGKKFDPTRKQWKMWGFDPNEVTYEKVVQKFTPEQYLKLCQLSKNDEIKKFKKQIKEETIPGLDKKGESFVSKFGQDPRDIRSKHFMIKFGTGVVGKNEGVIFLDGKWFACAFLVPKGYGDYAGKWIINPHTGSIKLYPNLGQLNISFKTLKDVIDHLEKWYDNKFSKTPSKLTEWHENFPLTGMTDGETFWFFRNKTPAGHIQHVVRSNTDKSFGFLIGLGVKRSLQGTGIGHSMIHFVFKTMPNLERLSLRSTAHSFYHKIGGKRDKKMAKLSIKEASKYVTG
jgi:hypothetical protein